MAQAARLRHQPSQRPQSLGNARIDGVSGQGVVSPYAVGSLDQDRASSGANGLQARPADGAAHQNERDGLLGLLGRRTIAPERWNEWIRGHWRIENASHHVRDVAFAEDASRIRKNPDIVARLRSFAYNLIRASGDDNIQNARWRAALDLNLALEISELRTKQPCAAPRGAITPQSRSPRRGCHWRPMFPVFRSRQTYSPGRTSINACYMRQIRGKRNERIHLRRANRKALSSSPTSAAFHGLKLAICAALRPSSGQPLRGIKVCQTTRCWSCC